MNNFNLLYAQVGGSPGSGIAAFLPFLMIGVIFYFFILRPQSKQKKEHENMLSNLKKGVIIVKDENNSEHKFEINSGVVEMKTNTISILAN